MKFILAAQLYWPVWIAFAYYSYSKTGMLAGTLAVTITWLLLIIGEKK